MEEEKVLNNALVTSSDLCINYPSDLLNFSLEFGSLALVTTQANQQTIATNQNYSDIIYYGRLLKTYTSNYYHHVLDHAGQERLL